MPASDHPSHPAIEILTADEVADLLRVNRKTIYESAQRGEIPHRRLGRRLVFERGAVLAWLRQGERGLDDLS
jgi:excisionase family DNA binding protein